MSVNERAKKIDRERTEPVLDNDLPVSFIPRHKSHIYSFAGIKVAFGVREFWERGERFMGLATERGVSELSSCGGKLQLLWSLRLSRNLAFFKTRNGSLGGVTEL